MKPSKGEINYEFGVNVKRERIAKGLTQEELAEKSGVTSVYIGEIERNLKSVSLKVAEQIANGLSMELEELIKYDKSEEDL